MKLHRLTLRNYRGISDVTVDFDDGITVVEGPNEIGKSSLAEALRLMRQFKDSTSHSTVKALQPVGEDVGPEVGVELTTGPYRLTYFKRWIKNRATELRVMSPAVESLTGGRAHDRYEQILTDTVDTQLLAALEVQQGDSLDQAVVAQLPALKRALDTAGGDTGGGTAPGGEAGSDRESSADRQSGSGGGSDPAESTDLLEAIEAEYRRYFTAGGKPTGEYAKIAIQVADLTAQCRGLEQDSVEQDKLANLHRAAQQRVTEKQATLQEAMAARDSLRQESAALDDLRAALAAAEKEHTEAQQASEDAVRLLDERSTLIQDVTALTEAAAGAATELAAAQAAFSTATSELQNRQRARDQAHDRLDAARARARHASHRVNRQRAAAELTDLQRRVVAARSAQAAVETAEAAISTIRATPDAVSELMELETQLRVARSAREAAAATITVDAAVPTVLVDGVAALVGGGESHPVLDEVVVEVPGVATIRVTPGTPPAELDAQVTRAAEVLDAALKALGAESVKEARTASLRRAEAEQARSTAQAQLDSVLDGQTLADLEQSRATAQQHATDIDPSAEPGTETEPRGNVGPHGNVEPDGNTEPGGNVAPSTDAEPGANEDSGSALDDCPADDSAAALAQAAVAADEAVDDAEADLRACDSALDAAREQADNARESVARATGTAEAAAAVRDRESERLSIARQSVSDDALTVAVTAASTRLRQVITAVDEARANLTAANADGLEMQLDNAEALVPSTEREVKDAEGDVIHYQTRVDEGAKKGIYDALADTRSKLDAASSRHAQLDRAAAAARLLRDTVRRHYRDAQRRYVAPFTSHIEQLGRVVFGPSFTIEISDELQVVSRSLDGRRVPFDALSAGAQEQIALLGRLACAQLIDQEDGAPVILDDTLGFADPQRLTALQAVLHKVGQTAQIIVLTCQPERFAQLGGAKRVRLG